MKSNVPVQAYVPCTIAAWVEGQARKAGTSRSHWIGKVLTDHYEGHVRDDALRPGQERLIRQMTFTICALDGLLAGHPDGALRERVHAAFKAKVSASESREAGQ